MLAPRPFLSLAPAVLAQITGPSAPGTGPEVANPFVSVREVAQDVRRLWGDGRWLLFTRDETDTDLNGDGDTSDTVFARHDLRSGATLNLGLAGTELRALGGGRALISVYEASQGLSDLNGDGDISDSVVFGLDLATGITTNSGMAEDGISNGGLFVGSRAVFAVSEARQGSTDLDGNGVVGGEVAFLWESFAAAPISLGLAVATGNLPMVSHRSYLLVAVLESVAGDRNGDGDTQDRVLHSVDLDEPSLTPINTQLAVSRIEAAGARSAFLVDEWRQGADLNLDGDAFDDVLHVYDVDSGQLSNLGLAVGEALASLDHGAVATGIDYQLSEEALVFFVSELSQDADQNGDGSLDDTVLFVRHFASGTTLNLGLAGWTFALGDGVLAFDVNEAYQGVDLDGDGATSHFVTHLHRFATHATTNLGLAASEPVFGSMAIGGSRLACAGLEGGVDQNGDGDGSDSILYLVDVATAQAQSQHVSVRLGHRDPPYVTFSPEGWLSFPVRESSEGRDLNFDGDTQDTVQQFLEMDSGIRINPGLALNGAEPLQPGHARRHPLKAADGSLQVVRLRL